MILYRTAFLPMILFIGTALLSQNLAPVFDPISDKAVIEDSGASTLQITGISAGTGESTQTVQFTASSSKATIIPNPAITGTGGTRTLSFQPANDANGIVTIKVIATDNGNPVQSFSRTFEINVKSVNDNPIRTNPATLQNVSAVQASQFVQLGLSNLTYSPGPTNETSQALTFQVTAIPPNTLGTISTCPSCALVLVGSFYTISQMRNLVFKSGINAEGSGIFSWKVTDNGSPAKSINQSLTISVTGSL